MRTRRVTVAQAVVEFLIAQRTSRDGPGEQNQPFIGGVFGISHPAVSPHLMVLRDSGFTSVRADGQRRLYAVEPGPLEEVDAWVAQFRHFWGQRLDALGTELRRGARGREAPGRTGAQPSDSPDQARRTTP